MSSEILGKFLDSVYFINIFAAFFFSTMLFARGCPRRDGFWPRALGGIVGMLALCLAFARIWDGSLLWEILLSAVLLLGLLGWLRMCYAASFWTLLFYFGSGFMTWYIADRAIIILTSLGRCLPGLAPFLAEGTLSHICLYCGICAGMYLAIYATVGRVMAQLEGSEIPASNALLLLLVVSILTPIFYFESAWMAQVSLLSYTLLNLGEIVYYLSMLLVQIIMLRAAQESARAAILQKLWLQEQKQYQLTKENLEAINIKCHDLKHQIRSLGRHQQVDPAYLEELEASVNLYNTTIHTGNETLDVILMDKRLHCLSKGIQLTAMTDGRYLNAMRVMDIYSLFGNALDNAMEATEQLPAEQRFIHLSIRHAGKMVAIHVENPYQGTLSMDGGIPRTTKADKQCHGFGMASIRHIVARYGGDLQIRAQDGLFCLNILLPLPEDGKAV